MDLTSAATTFHAGSGYLDSATVGVPTAGAVEAMTADLEHWRAGRLTPRRYDGVVGAARQAYASLVQASADRVGIISQVSVATGVVASALHRGDRVVVAEEDFTSVLFPLLQAQDRGVVVDVVSLDQLLDAVDDQTTLVAVSAVQSSDGRRLDLDALAEAAASTGAMTYVDLTQAAGWLPGIGADRFSVTACGAYKWLCSPRGSGFMTVDPTVAERFPPIVSGWYAGEDVWNAIYGPPLRLADDGRRYDTSPAWNSWVGAVPSLQLLSAVGVEAIGAHDVKLANAFRDRMGEEPSGSAIATVTADGALDALTEAGIRCAGRGGRARLAFHLYSTEEDVDRAARALGG